jgi:hypothetical protein
MHYVIRGVVALVVVALLSVSLAACDVGTADDNGAGADGDGEDLDNGDGPGDGQLADDGTYDIDADGIPRFAAADYINLGSIHRISKFRSGVGHDYWDSVESCRSLKHYFEPAAGVVWSAVRVYSPVDGAVVRTNEEWAGAQVHVQSDDYPAFTFILFHVSLSEPLAVGDTVAAGQQLGTHIGTQTMSDVAVGVSTPNGWRLVSYFDVMTDSVFAAYKARGVTARSDVVISKEARDADPLTCDGEAFADEGNLENWVILD